MKAMETMHRFFFGFAVITLASCDGVVGGGDNPGLGGEAITALPPSNGINALSGKTYIVGLIADSVVLPIKDRIFRNLQWRILWDIQRTSDKIQRRGRVGTDSGERQVYLF